MTEVRLPKPGDAITEALVSAIHVPDGSWVEEGTLLYTIETDKVEMDIDAPAGGRVQWKAEAGATYSVGDLLAVIE